MDGRHDERRMLADSVDDFVRGEATIPRVRALLEQGECFSREVWGQLAELGWLGIQVPETAGGLELGPAELAIVAEGLGRARLPEPFTEVAGFTAAVLRAGDNAELRDTLLADLASGASIPAVAWQEDAEQFNPARVATEVSHTAGGPVLTGRKRLVVPAQADDFIISASSTEGVALYRVAADAEGVEAEHHTQVDGSRVADLRLRSVPVGDADLVASPGCGLEALKIGLAWGQVFASAELLGLSERLLDMTRDYLSTRKQFDQPLSGFQVLRHRMVDLYIQIQLMRAALRQALRVLERGGDTAEAELAASRAKARASAAAMTVARQAVQLHGAIGYTEEADVGVHLHRVVTLSTWLGNAAWHRRRYAALLPRESREAA